jgi:hypothetical protein
MAALRFWALCVALVAVACIAVPNHGMAEPVAQLRLELVNPPGGLRLVNPGSAPATILAMIAVEKQQENRWAPVLTEFCAVARCNGQDRRDMPVQVEIAPAVALEVRPWLGFSCFTQCNNVCHANVYYGPGTFRFVVTTVPMGERLVSPAFLPPRQPLSR